jgi:hypothetical protein
MVKLVIVTEPPETIEVELSVKSPPPPVDVAVPCISQVVPSLR